MANPENFPPIFLRLKAVLAPFAPPLLVEADTADRYSLTAPPSVRYPKGLYFGGVQVRKSYVSYYLMPVYVFPDLLSSLTDRLARRKQGNACFNFGAIDDAVFAELTQLTAAGFARYTQEGIV